MKITNKTVGGSISIMLLSTLVFSPLVEFFIHGCKFWGSGCEWGVTREYATIALGVLLSLGVLLVIMGMLLGDIEFEYEIKLPKSKRKTLNKLYSKMGEAAIRGDEREEKRIWETIQKMENR